MNPIAVFDRPEQSGGSRVRGPGLQGAPWVGRNVVGSVPSRGGLQETSAARSGANQGFPGLQQDLGARA